MAHKSSLDSDKGVLFGWIKEMSVMQKDFRQVFDKNILIQFKKAISISIRNPKMFCFFLFATLQQLNAVIKRKKQLRRGIEVPPLLIISITKRCNLNCKGCYSKKLHTNATDELTPQRFDSILRESDELGVSLVLLAGGEPLVRADLIQVTDNYKSILFPIFTNGTLLTNEILNRFRKNKHLIPVISLEGDQDQTDLRRGDGIYQKCKVMVSSLTKAGIFWGISLTVTSKNFDTVLSRQYLNEFVRIGGQLFFFVEYVPIEEGSQHLVLLPEQKMKLQSLIDQRMKELPGLFIGFPGDEEQYDGCLAAGRGFLHINPAGDVEPCPFAPFSDSNVKDKGIKAALQSELLSKVRLAHDKLKETDGGCALWSNREWMEELLIKQDNDR